jgi:hypothetical protein
MDRVAAGRIAESGTDPGFVERAIAAAERNEKRG